MNKLFLTAIVVVAASIIHVYTVEEPAVTPIHVAASVVPPVETKKRYVPTQAQEVWISALEWCESRARPAAINAEDVDGTPSYYSFQFKPSTFKWLALKYEILSLEDVSTDEKVMEQIKNRDVQRDIVRGMVGDKSIKFHNQFPDCVNRKIGPPPTY